MVLGREDLAGRQFKILACDWAQGNSTTLTCHVDLQVDVIGRLGILLLEVRKERGVKRLG
jgi:hypothetical protein